MKRIPELEQMSLEEELAFVFSVSQEADNLFIDEVISLYNPSGVVLDIGCGPGVVLSILLEKINGLKGIGVDCSSLMVERAIQEARKRWVFDRMEVKKLRLPDEELVEPNKFDFILSRSVLHHFIEPNRFWEVVKKYAKQTAKILVCDFLRPSSIEEVDEITENRFPIEQINGLKDNFKQIWMIKRKLFWTSLISAFTIEEIEEQLQNYKELECNVKKVDDYHIRIVR